METGTWLPEWGAHPLARSVVGGCLAYAAGILAIAALNPVERDGSNPIAFAANRFYSAHFVFIDRRASDSNGNGVAVDVATSPTVDASTLSPFLFYAIPIVVLLLVGHRLARSGAGDEPELKAVLGAATVLGYLPLTILGTFAFTARWTVGSGAVTAAPELELWTVLIMGIAYPLVFGGIGGALAGKR